MDLITGTPFSPLKTGQPAAYPPLDEHLECEVLVIGGGVSGAMVAHELARAGIATIVVDRRDVATGSTAASTSLLQYEPDLPLHRLIRLRGEHEAVRCYRACREAFGDIEKLARHLGPAVPFTRRPSLLLARGEHDVPALQHELVVRRRHGMPVEFWPRRRLAAASSLPHCAALLTPDAGVTDAYALCHALLQAAGAAGTRIFARTAVTRIRHLSTGVVAQTDRQARIRAHKVVIAAGYEAESLLGGTRSRLHSTYAIATLPVNEWVGWPADCLWWDTGRPYLYARPTNDGRVIIGGYDVPFRDQRSRDALLRPKTAALLRRLRALFPNMACETAYAWTGTFAATPDSLPYIGTSARQADTYLTLGYGGNGIIFSHLGATIIRDHLLRIPNPHADLFRVGR